jgi:CubicO group peptidase (beta-lactamase class C family)
MGPDGAGLGDWDLMQARIAACAPGWVPGTALGYQALTYGWLVGEVIRRVSGRTPGRFFREEIAAALNRSERTVANKLLLIRRIWVEAGLATERGGNAGPSLTDPEDGGRGQVPPTSPSVS